MKHLFVINPHSFRKKRYDHIVTEIDNRSREERDFFYDIYVSRYPRDAVVAVSNYIKKVALDEIVRVYAVGGDGILFDCLNGIINHPNAELTNVPYGKANDFLRGCFGIKAKELFRDIKTLSKGQVHLVDAMQCGTNYAINEVV